MHTAHFWAFIIRRGLRRFRGIWLRKPKKFFTKFFIKTIFFAANLFCIDRTQVIHCRLWSGIVGVVVIVGLIDQISGELYRRPIGQFYLAKKAMVIGFGTEYAWEYEGIIITWVLMQSVRNGVMSTRPPLLGWWILALISSVSSVV